MTGVPPQPEQVQERAACVLAKKKFEFLNYDQEPRRVQRVARHFRWFAIALLVACLAGLLVPLLSRMQLLHLQRASLAYAPRRSQVIYEEDAVIAKEMLNNGGYASATDSQVVGSGRYPTPVAAAYRPDIVDEFVHSAGITLFSPDKGERSSVAFFGALTTPQGERRLVLVEFLPRGSSANVSCGFIYVFKPGRLFGGGPRLVNASAIPWTWGELRPWMSLLAHPRALREPEAFRIYAGEVDPTDPSSFQIRVRVRGLETVVRGQIDGRDSVLLSSSGYASQNDRGASKGSSKTGASSTNQ